ncbi:MAG: hypothetical protein EBR82_43110 [Caulobacteraceae bacterium]|nr:hypothetical protein [Caulobacteraceae bacterium]
MYSLMQECQMNDRAIEALPQLIELLYAALPYVEEGEEFNKPNAPKLSAKIRAALKKGGF